MRFRGLTVDCNHCGEYVDLIRWKPAQWMRKKYRKAKLDILLSFRRIDIHQYCQRLLGIDARPSDGYVVVERAPHCTFCDAVIPESRAFMTGMVTGNDNEVIHSRSGICDECVARLSSSENQAKPEPSILFATHIRVDIEYRRDGSLVYALLELDQRKRQQRQFSRMTKWRRRSWGIVSNPQDDETELRRATHYTRGPLSSIAARLNHELRHFSVKLQSANAGKPQPTNDSTEER